MDKNMKRNLSKEKKIEYYENRIRKLKMFKEIEKSNRGFLELRYVYFDGLGNPESVSLNMVDLEDSDTPVDAFIRDAIQDCICIAECEIKKLNGEWPIYDDN